MPEIPSPSPSDSPPGQPLLIWDGDCGFCRRFILRWQRITEGRVDYAPYQEVAESFPQIPRERFERSVVLVAPDGSTWEGAAAVFAALARAPGWGFLLRCYRRVPGFATASEGVYRLVASHRMTLSRVAAIAWGKEAGPQSYVLCRWLFVRALALVYLAAFLSLSVQVRGLIGQGGVTPAADLMNAVRAQVGVRAYWMLPSVFWLDAGDAALEGACFLGAGVAALIFFGAAPAPSLLALWILYLSLASVGNVFLEFQWDALLLETGLLAVLFAPLSLRSSLDTDGEPARSTLWLMRFLCFRLMFASGMVKLLSGDKTWRDLSALLYHYQTQPLPTRVGYYAHHLPGFIQRLSCVGMFACELALPWLIFAPRRLRLLGAAALAALQVVILLTGNYGFFNWLTIALCLPLCDDAALVRLLPRRLRPQPRPPARFSAPSARLALLLVSIPLFILSGSVFVRGLTGKMPMAMRRIQRWVAPSRSFNSYGLFAVMTTKRPEIAIEGSDDRVTWRPYELRYEPGDCAIAPHFVAPHQPRLDWQIWFAALGSVQENEWFVNLMVRLLQGQREVTALFAKDPFPERPPRFVRAVLYDYEFTTLAERRATGRWWSRRELGLYCPVMSLR